MRPVLFWLLITSSSVPDDVNSKDVREEDLLSEGIVAHRFTGLSTQRQRDSLESISNWRQRFPYLQQLVTAGQLQCDIIHMDVSLSLLVSHPPEGAELCCQTVLSFSQPHEYEWRIVTTFNRPPELYRDPHSDPPVEREACVGQATSLVDGETRVKIPFPAVGWANAVTCLTNLQAKYEENSKNQAYGSISNSNIRLARDYVEQISMYQEVLSSPAPRMPFTRRAIIVWTFHQALDSEGNGTHWRYLDPLPPRRSCMSPSPHASHHISASMSENFNNWAEAPLQLCQNMLNPFAQSLVTTPSTAGLQSPFDSHNFGPISQGFDLPSENQSFASSHTIDSDVTLVDHDIVANIDHFLSTEDVDLGNYDHSTNWALPSNESFDADPAWASYNFPSSTPAIGWDGNAKGQNGWNDIPVAVADVSGKQIGWVDDEGGKHEWRNEGQGSPVKMGSYVEGIEQKLEDWIEENRSGEEKGGYSEVGEMDGGTVNVDGCSDETDQMHEWDVVDDGFDYASLAERLKS
jgi:transcriptional enhancer factor